MARKIVNNPLLELVSVGPATVHDFTLLGITTLKQLARWEAHPLYKRLCEITQKEHDPCVEDVFAAAIAQARDPDLPEEQKQWAYWSKIRKKRPKRCAWAQMGNALDEHYHDTEWGVPAHDDKRLFEFLILEGAQAGLSWRTILQRRAGYEKAFAGFDWERVAAFTPSQIEKLMHCPDIIRNRAKIQAAVINARIFSLIREEYGSFDAYVWKFVGGKTLQSSRKPGSKLPALSPESEALSKDLKKRGCKFVGPTIMYAYMQAMGLINDHTTDCFCYSSLAFT